MGGIAVEDQYLVSAGRPLEYGLLDVSPLSTIEVGVRMLGGKVHGSLARAGKVKGQTPKVEKQEKKKVKLAAPSAACSTTSALSTLSLASARSVDPTPRASKLFALSLFASAIQQAQIR